MKVLRGVFKGVFFAILLVFISCAHYKSKTSFERQLIFSGQGAMAAEKLKSKAHQSSRDQLLYLLDLSMAYHSSGAYKEAIASLLLAEKIAEYKDFTSITEETGTLLVTDNVKNYKGEDFEKILINIYLAIDYMMLGELEDALVEVRKVNQLLYRLINEGKRPYNLNPLAYYLGGFLYEKNRDVNDAYIDYKSTQKVVPELGLIGEDLKGLARKLGFHEDLTQWERLYPSTTSLTPANPTGRKDLTQKNMADVLILAEVGRAPEKVPHPQFESLPTFRNVPYRYTGIRLFLDGKPLADSLPIFSVEKTAHLHLDHRIKAMTVKKVVGLAAKAAVGAGVAAATKDENLGILTTMLLMAMDQADLRSWLTLPAEFHMIRVAIPAGVHTIELRYLIGSELTAAGQKLEGFESKPGAHQILHHRVFE